MPCVSFLNGAAGLVSLPRSPVPTVQPLQGVISGSVPWNSGFGQRAIGSQAVAGMDKKLEVQKLGSS